MRYAIIFCVLLPALARGQTIELEPRTVRSLDGDEVAYEHGTLIVPERRGVPGSRRIRIAFARLRAKARTGVPPIVLLPGGPGSSMLDAFTAPTPANERRLAFLRRLQGMTDVVVLDQRGFTTLVAPKLPSGPLDRPSSPSAAAEVWRQYARELARLNPGADLAGYELRECVADVDDLRRALGYPRISLIGGSFGSQWSFAVMRLRPAIVARALLVGVEPLDAGFDRPQAVYAAMQRIALEADRDPGLAPYLPPGGLMAAVTTVRDRLARGPITVTVDGEAIVLGLADLQGALIPGDAKAWPAFVLSLLHGRYDAWARAERDARKGPPFSSPINPLIDSGIGGSAPRLRTMASDPATAFLGDWGWTPHVASRAAWPTADLGDELRTPVLSKIPVLFLTGDWDTSTPVENALEIAPYFPASRVVVVHRGEHGSITYLTREHPRTLDAVVEFLRSGSTTDLPADLTLTAPSFTRPEL